MARGAVPEAHATSAASIFALALAFPFSLGCCFALAAFAGRASASSGGNLRFKAPLGPAPAPSTLAVLEACTACVAFRCPLAPPLATFALACRALRAALVPPFTGSLAGPV